MVVKIVCEILTICSFFFALFKILKINEIGVCKCTIVYFDVLKVYYFFGFCSLFA